MYNFYISSPTHWFMGLLCTCRSLPEAISYGRKRMTLGPEQSWSTGKKDCLDLTTFWISGRAQMWRLCWQCLLLPGRNFWRLLFALWSGNENSVCICPGGIRNRKMSFYLYENNFKFGLYCPFIILDTVEIAFEWKVFVDWCTRTYMYY